MELPASSPHTTPDRSTQAGGHWFPAMCAADAVMTSVVSVGYEGRDVDGLLASLRLHHVDVLVDARLIPLSRKPGLSKKGLATTLGTHGIRYLHLRALGDPKDNRALLWTGDSSSRNRFTACFEPVTAAKHCGTSRNCSRHRPWRCSASNVTTSNATGS